LRNIRKRHRAKAKKLAKLKQAEETEQKERDTNHEKNSSGMEIQNNQNENVHVPPKTDNSEESSQKQKHSESCNSITPSLVNQPKADEAERKRMWATLPAQNIIVVDGTWREVRKLKMFLNTHTRRKQHLEQQQEQQAPPDRIPVTLVSNAEDRENEAKAPPSTPNHPGRDASSPSNPSSVPWVHISPPAQSLFEPLRKQAQPGRCSTF